MKTIAALLVSSCTVLAQTNGVPAPEPPATPEDFWKWAIGVVGVLVVGFTVYFIKKSKAPKS